MINREFSRAWGHEDEAENERGPTMNAEQKKIQERGLRLSLEAAEMALKSAAEEADKLSQEAEGLAQVNTLDAMQTLTSRISFAQMRMDWIEARAKRVAEHMVDVKRAMARWDALYYTSAALNDAEEVL